MEILRKVMLWAVLGVWFTNWLAGFVAATGIAHGFEYKPDEAINGIFMVVAGGLVAAEKYDAHKKKEKVKQNGGHDDAE